MTQGPGFGEVSERYEAWRGRRIQLIAADLQSKYARMAQSPWLLARGAYHRFATQFPVLLPELAATPVAVSVGDLHAEKFGTWRDHAGRLVWGANGLEEVDLLPYAADLVRLASSVVLAIEAGLLAISVDAAVDAILAGWSARIAARHPTPFVLGAAHADIFELHRPALRDPVSFAAELEALPAFERALPKPAARMLAAVTPGEDFRPRLKRGPAGFASLGARRIIAVGDVDGGQLAREVLQVPGPVSMWDTPKRTQVAGLAGAIDAARGIAAEPAHRQSRKWVVRGLDGGFSSLELPLPSADTESLLVAMGTEAANVQLTEVAESAPRKAIRRDAAERPAGWLTAAAQVMAEAARSDHAAWSQTVDDRGEDAFSAAVAGAGGDPEL